MFKRLVLVALCLLLAFPALSKINSAPEIVAQARDMATGDLLYTEVHFFSNDKDLHRVEYRAADQSLIAVKEVDYRNGDAAPTFVLKNLQYPEQQSASYRDGKLMVGYKEGDEPEETAEVSIKTPLVIDAGFDRFVQQNWSELVAGNDAVFYFAVPSSQMLAKLFVEQDDCDKGAGGNLVCFRATLTNFIFRWFVTPIKVSYNLETRQLNSYSGVSNFASVDGYNPKVTITYAYDQQSLASADDVEDEMFFNIMMW